MLRCLFILLSLLWLSPADAQLPRPGENAISVSLLPAGTTIPRGEAVPLAIVMRPKEGWHGYWKNPGDAGTEARVEWDLPPGVTVGPLRYPVPDRLTIAGLMNYVFERDYALLTELRVSPSVPVGSRLPIRMKIDHLACTDEICVPETAVVTGELVVGGPGAALENRATIDRYAQALPRPLGTEARFAVEGERLRIAIPLPGEMKLAEPYFYPETLRAIEHAAVQVSARTEGFLVIETKAGRDAASLQSLEGVLEYTDGEGLKLSARPGPVPAVAVTPIAPVPEPKANPSSVLVAFFGALVGGLLLNIMPCVFPILSLKALSLAKAGGEERSARREALAYTGGAVLTCLALGGALLLVRAGGEAVGWAFQLQDPRVILILLLLVTAISLNLAGLFELPALTGGSGLARSGGAAGAFWTGALAAFIATPCTGPFMGVALGAALVLPTAGALAVFGGLGLGLALPFLLLGFVPALRRRLPKPGPWMSRLRRVLSIPMFLTALGLAWILGRQAGVDGMALGLAASLVLGLSLWWLGRRQGKGGFLLPLAPAAAAAVAALLVVPAASTPAAAQSTDTLGSEPFSEQRLAALRSEGRPVFVYFTADWCVTCKVNEKGVLERSEVANAFAAADVAVLRGDWTRGDPEIGRFLETHGRSGVPLYLYYAPGANAEILPQILTTERLTGLI